MGPDARQIAARKVRSARIEARIALDMELHQLQQREWEADDDFMQHAPNPRTTGATTERGPGVAATAQS